MRPVEVSAFLGTVLTALCLVAPVGADDGTADEALPTYLHLSDVHLDLQAGTSCEPYSSACDTPEHLWEITLEKLGRVISGQDLEPGFARPDFLVYTGDLPGHDPDSGPEHDENVQRVLEDLHDLVTRPGQEIPLLYMPGNNDALSQDYGSFEDESRSPAMTPLDLVPGDHFPAVNASQACSSSQPPPCMVSNPHPSFGYYSARPIGGLRVLALNSIIFGTKYFPADGTSQEDAGDPQMDWIHDQLKDARLKGDKVLLAMHIPPGVDAHGHHSGGCDRMWIQHPCEDTEGCGWPSEGTCGETHGQRGHDAHWLDRFLGDLWMFRDLVIGIAYGHTHMDELRRLHSPTTSGIFEVAISAPGITSGHGNNPGFKLVSYRKSDMALWDFVTYYTTPNSSDEQASDEQADGTSPWPDAWGDATYTFRQYFGCQGEPILDCLQGIQYDETLEVNRQMGKIFTVRHHDSTSWAAAGIEVKVGQ